jgi:adenylate kinase
VELIQRADDEESTIRTRLEVYREQTEPLVGYYRSRGRLIEVDGVGTPRAVYETMKQAIVASVGGR